MPDADIRSSAYGTFPFPLRIRLSRSIAYDYRRKKSSDFDWRRLLLQSEKVESRPTSAGGHAAKSNVLYITFNWCLIQTPVHLLDSNSIRTDQKAKFRAVRR